MKGGELVLPHIERLDDIAPFIAKIRIAKGVSQTELARRLGVCNAWLVVVAGVVDGHRNG